MDEIETLRKEIERLKSDRPSMDESPADTGHKLLAIGDLLLRIAEVATRR
jgi:hypothetical protein